MTTYTFSPLEQQQIIDAYNLGPDAQGLPGNHVNYYSEVAEILSDDMGSGAPDDLPLVAPVRLWFDGASKVNAGEGSFSVLIREYTQNQGILHWGQRFGVFQPSGALSKIQEASNALARSTFTALTGEQNWLLFPIQDVANFDADEISKVLFERITQDTINSSELLGQSAAWSGVLLFSSFDQPDVPGGAVDETGRLISTGSPDTADTLDDWRNVLYANYSYTNGVLAAGLEGASELLSTQELGSLLEDGRTFFEVCLLSGRCGASVANAVREQAAEDAFAPVLLYGGVDTLNLLKSGADGEINQSAFLIGFDQGLSLEFSTNFAEQARALFGSPGSPQLANSATLHTVDALVRDAQSGDGLARKALQGLSPFKVNNGVSVNVNVPEQYWADRGRMTEARLLVESQLVELPNLTADNFDDPFIFTDLNASLTYQIDNNNLPLTNFREITFGTTGSEALIGGDFDDSLYGSAGDDALDGGLGNDFLSGGTGSDSYVISDGRDRIFDADGRGTIQLNGIKLTGGERLASVIYFGENAC